MTLTPLIAPEIRGVKGNDPEFGVWCSVPGCISKAQEGHHLWPRSYLQGQPQGWVMLPSGHVIGNKTGLCVRHHRAVSSPVGGHQAWVRLEAGDVLVWYERAPHDVWLSRGALTQQPPIKRLGKIERDIEKVHPHLHLAEGETCESCGYTRPVAREPLPRRPSASWNVIVPHDTEIGAEILDDWIDQFAVILGLGSGKQRLRRYHVLTVVLAWAMMNKPEFIKDVIGRENAA